MNFKRSLGLALSILMVVMPIIPINARADILKSDVYSNDKFDLKKEVSKNSFIKDEEFDIKYTVTPKDIPYESVPENREIVFILDTSNSMKYNVINRPADTVKELKIENDDKTILQIPNNRRIDIVKNSLKSFIEKNNLYGKSTIVTFNMCGQLKKINSKSDIDSINVSQSSNLGDGLRVAYNNYKNDLSNKTFIVITDGKPNIRSYYVTSKNNKALRPDFIGEKGTYTEKSSYESAFNTDTGEPWGNFDPNKYSAIDIPEDGSTSGGFEDGNLNFDDSIDASKTSDEKDIFNSGDINTKNYGIDRIGIAYASKILKIMENGSTYKNNFKCYMVGVTKDQTGIDNLNSICTGENDKSYGEVSQVVSNDELTSVLNNICDSSKVKDISFEEIFPQGIEPVSTSLPSLKIEGNKVSGDLNNISYAYDTDKKVYHAEPVSFTVKVKGKEVKSYDISKDEGGNNTSILRYKDTGLKSVDTYLNFPVLNVNIEKISLMDIKRDCSVTSAQRGDTFDVTYTIVPKSIPVTENINSNKERDVILVIDTSGSMKYVPEDDREPSHREKSRLDIMKEVSKKFIENFKDKEKIRIALMEYANLSYSVNDMTNVTLNNINSINNKINKFQAGGSTNTGDGLRYAYNKLINYKDHEKYIVLMTDGEPEAYGVDEDNKFYMGSGDKPYGVYESLFYNHWFYGKIYNPDYRVESLKYAKKVAKELIAPNDIKTFVIGFGSSASLKNGEIASASKGTYINAQDEAAINNVFNGIEKIIDTNINGNAHFEETISSNLEVENAEDLPLGLKIDGDKIVGDIKNIYYKLSEDKKTYNGDAVQFTIKYRTKGDGDYIFGKDNSSYVKLDVLNNTESKNFDTLTIPNVAIGENNILKHGLFLRNNSKNDYVTEGINGQLNVVNDMSVTLGMIADIKSTKVLIALQLDKNYKNENIEFNKYEIVNGEMLKNSLQTITLNPMLLNITGSDSFLLEVGKKYLITYTITPEGKENDSINVITKIDSRDDSEKLLKLNIRNKPDVY